jgi:hypothetical protein
MAISAQLDREREAQWMRRYEAVIPFPPPPLKIDTHFHRFLSPCVQEQRMAIFAQLDREREAQNRRRHEMANTSSARGKQPAGAKPQTMIPRSSSNTSLGSYGGRSVGGGSMGGGSMGAGSVGRGSVGGGSYGGGSVGGGSMGKSGCSSWGGLASAAAGGGVSYAGGRRTVPLSQATIELTRVGGHVAGSARSSGGDSEIVD